jgi:hypothetical protein
MGAVSGMVTKKVGCSVTSGRQRQMQNPGRSARSEALPTGHELAALPVINETSPSSSRRTAFIGRQAPAENQAAGP